MIIETNLQNKPVDLVLPISDVTLPSNEAERQAFLENLAIFIEHSDGSHELKTPEIVTYKDGQIGLKFNVTKFSTFTILKINESASAEETQENEAKPYIVGFADGSFQPNKALTRAEIASILSRVEAGTKWTETPNYTDVKETHWAYNVIQDASATGLMKGYSNGTFGPDKSITRAEIAAIISRWLKLDGLTQVRFQDSQNHWAANDIGLVSAAAVAVFNRILKRTSVETTTPSFKDVPSTHWAFKDIETASKR